MANEQVFKAIYSPNFRRTVARFRYEAPEIVEKNIGTTIRRLQAAAINEARNQLKVAVYDAPLPSSVGKTYPNGRLYWTVDEYVKQRRTGQVWKSIVRTPVLVTERGRQGDVKVDKERAGWDGFYHAWILNHGGYATRTGFYKARPYWTITVVRMRVLLKSLGREGAAGMVQGLLGRSYLLEDSVPEVTA